MLYRDRDTKLMLVSLPYCCLRCSCRSRSLLPVASRRFTAARNYYSFFIVRYSLLCGRQRLLLSQFVMQTSTNGNTIYMPVNLRCIADCEVGGAADDR
jgi:hypothetical protein